MANTSTKFVPGPSAYSIKSRVGEGPAYVMGSRNGDGAMGSSKKVPGPGAYSPGKRDMSASYSMGSKTKFGMQIVVKPETGEHTKMAFSADKTPGPGTYTFNPVYRNVNGGQKFGTDSRKGMGDPRSGLTPGPNAYRANNKVSVQKAAPSYGFGTS